MEEDNQEENKLTKYVKLIAYAGIMIYIIMIVFKGFIAVMKQVFT